MLRVLIPWSFMFGCIVWLRRTWYQYFPKKQLPIPVIVVGNITVGGTGKTPFVITLAKQLATWGYRPGIIARGYGGYSNHYPLLVDEKSVVPQVGDESFMIFKETDLPVCVDPNRRRGAEFLIRQTNCNIIVSDDGLQHAALPRNIEIALVDERAFGNGWLLPAGPQREPRSRLCTVDYVVYASEQQCRPTGFIQLSTKHVYPLDFFKGKKVHAVSAIACPERFLKTLSKLEITAIPQVFPDHYVFKKIDLIFEEPFPIVMTHKDATKCTTFNNLLIFYLTIETQIPTNLQNNLKTRLSEICE